MKSWSTIHRARWQLGVESLRCALQGEALPNVSAPSSQAAAKITPSPRVDEVSQTGSDPITVTDYQNEIREEITTTAPKTKEFTLPSLNAAAFFTSIPWNGKSDKSHPPQAPENHPTVSQTTAAPPAKTPVRDSQLTEPALSFFEKIPWNGEPTEPAKNITIAASKPSGAAKPPPPVATDSTPDSSTEIDSNPRQPSTSDRKHAPKQDSLIFKIKKFFSAGKATSVKEAEAIEQAPTAAKAQPLNNQTEPQQEAEHNSTAPQPQAIHLQSTVPEEIKGMPASAFFRSLSWRCPTDSASNTSTSRISISPAATAKNNQGTDEGDSPDGANMLAAGLRSAVRTSERASEAPLVANQLSRKLSKEFFQQIPWSNN